MRALALVRSFVAFAFIASMVAAGVFVFILAAAEWTK